ncbi:hypothetical protein L2E82_07136 [Cichorium intybus]|uniref:Uncharacterized protein n=1 Tax=Cichorium intybus TaxID=13427 RepID=A0ACB9G5P9_CICIN|nr:hypothetical protein L2E82_07136 [Cichorium intybus]
MANLILTLFILAVFFLAGTTADETPSSDFITSSCTNTTYPDLCVQTLSPYARIIQHNPALLARVSLNVTLNRSDSAQAYLHKLTQSKWLNSRERSAVGDCLEEVNDSVDRVRNSIREFNGVERFKGREFVLHMSNVQTWISSALTDENTCMDGFSGQDGRVQSSVRAQITDVAHFTSNALALINHFAEKHN